jgi:hypothetical protein
MFLFPLIYISSFLLSIREFLRGNKESILLFLIFGLSIYTSATSVANKLGFKESVLILQLFKEIGIISLLSWILYNYNGRLRLHLIDYALISFFAYTLLYALLPIGNLNVINRIISLKSSSFFVLVYFTGRLLNPKEIFLSKYFLYLMILAIAAAIVVLFEVFTNQHLQTFTGYTEFNSYFYNIKPSGHYGLSWTFESEGGFKRFASFFSNPLEHAAATLISLAILAAFYTNEHYRLKLDTFGVVTLVATLISIIYAVSRSSFVSYFILIYAYGWITRQKYINKIIHLGILVILVYVLYLLIPNGNDDYVGVQEIIVRTLNFTNTSSVAHLFEWIQGLNAIIESPLGLGIGTSGRVAGSLGENIGGENQFIVIGVQFGIIALFLYLLIYVSILKTSWQWYYRLEGKEKKVCLALLLIKIAFLIPSFTSELENSVYISYLTWFMTGIFVNMVSLRGLKGKDA